MVRGWAAYKGRWQRILSWLRSSPFLHDDREPVAAGKVQLAPVKARRATVRHDAPASVSNKHRLFPKRPLGAWH
jgi:hypothetical protein